MITETEAKMSLALEKLIPAGAQFCFSARKPDTAELVGSEQEAAAGMVSKRRAEFTHGRYCAREALALLGHKACAIPKAADRSPVWPAGIVGSISHSLNFAMAAAAPQTLFTGLGLDLEIDEPLTPDIIDLICRPDEIRSSPDNSKLLFCAKEAIYKCIYPLTGVFVDFQEMQVDLDQKSERFAAVSHSPKFAAGIVTTLEGRFTRLENLIFCSAWIRSPA